MLSPPSLSSDLEFKPYGPPWSQIPLTVPALTLMLLSFQVPGDFLFFFFLSLTIYVKSIFVMFYLAFLCVKWEEKVHLHQLSVPFCQKSFLN